MGGAGVVICQRLLCSVLGERWKKSQGSKVKSRQEILGLEAETFSSRMQTISIKIRWKLAAEYCLFLTGGYIAGRKFMQLWTYCYCSHVLWTYSVTWLIVDSTAGLFCFLRVLYFGCSFCRCACRVSVAFPVNVHGDDTQLYISACSTGFPYRSYAMHLRDLH